MKRLSWETSSKGSSGFGLGEAVGEGTGVPADPPVARVGSGDRLGAKDRVQRAIHRHSAPCLIDGRTDNYLGSQLNRNGNTPPPFRVITEAMNSNPPISIQVAAAKKQLIEVI